MQQRVGGHVDGEELSGGGEVSLAWSGQQPGHQGPDQGGQVGGGVTQQVAGRVEHDDDAIKNDVQ